MMQRALPGIGLLAGIAAMPVIGDVRVAQANTSTIAALADTAPPTVTLTCPAAGGIHWTSSPTLVLTGAAIDDAGVDHVIWSNDRGGGGEACNQACTVGRRDPTFAVSAIPLADGDNTITVTAYDLAANSGSASIVIRRVTSPGTIYADCSASNPGDGSQASPFNKLQDAIDLASTGDAINLAGSPCHEAVWIEKGIAISGDPSQSHVVIDGTQAGTCHPAFWPVTVLTDQPVTLKHLSPPSIGLGVFGSDDNEPSTHVLLDDIVGSNVSIRSGSFLSSSETTVTNSDLLRLGSAFPDIRGRVVVRDSRLAAADFYGSPLFLDLTMERSEVTGLSMTHEGKLLADIKNSVLHGGITAGGADTEALQVSITDSTIEGGGVSLSSYGFLAGLDVSLTRDVIQNSPIGVSNHDDAGSYSDHFAPVNIRIEDSLLEASPVNILLVRFGQVLNATPREVSFRNNVALGGGLAMLIYQDGDILNHFFPTELLAVNNTIVDAPLGIGITAVNDPGRPPLWMMNAFNNIIMDGETGISITGASLLDTTIFNNDVHGNSGADYDGELSDQTGLNGNISADPLFVNPAAGNYSLKAASPCIDTGLSDPAVPAADYNGTPRPQDGDMDGIALPDIGAFEFLLHDDDHDGYQPPLDCNDADASIHPGAIELPGNVVDEDCSGQAVCNPSAYWKSHGQFVSCVARACGALVNAGSVTQAQCNALISQAAQSPTGRRQRLRQPPGPREP